jgi:hypothetical protein
MLRILKIIVRKCRMPCFLLIRVNLRGQPAGVRMVELSLQSRATEYNTCLLFAYV